MTITIIIPTFNEEQNIKACLDSLLSQNLKSEIIVVDDGSTDNTIEILKKYQKKKQLKLIKQNHQGPALARNKGAKEARGDILVFADADMTFAKNYLKTLTKPIIDEDLIGTFTTEEIVSNWENLWARCWNIQEGWAPKKRFPKNPPKYGTDFRAILKREFDKVGGFDNIGYTDTWTLFQKLGIKPLATKAICYHKNPDSLRTVFKQAKWVAKRPYKLGGLGTLIALIRASLPFSVLIGLYRSFVNLQPAFLIFKLIFDLGRFIGILELALFQKTSK